MYRIIKSSYNGEKLNPATISGLIQSDGSFSISIVKAKSELGFIIRPVFSISLILSSTDLINRLKQYFCVGHVYVQDNYVQYTVSNFIELWHVIIPHFINYPLYGDKHKSFVKFVNIIVLLYPYHNRIKPISVLNIILNLMIDINNQTSLSMQYRISKINFKSTTNIVINKDYLRPLIIITPEFLIGLIEGDGSFYVSQRPNGNYRFGFSITTHIKELDLMYRVKRFLSFGNVSVSKTWCRFETQKIKFINDVIVPLVNSRGCLLGSKRRKYLKFYEIIKIIKNKNKPLY